MERLTLLLVPFGRYNAEGTEFYVAASNMRSLFAKAYKDAVTQIETTAAYKNEAAAGLQGGQGKKKSKGKSEGGAGGRPKGSTGAKKEKPPRESKKKDKPKEKKKSKKKPSNSATQQMQMMQMQMMQMQQMQQVPPNLLLSNPPPHATRVSFSSSRPLSPGGERSMVLR